MLQFDQTYRGYKVELDSNGIFIAKIFDTNRLVGLGEVASAESLVALLKKIDALSELKYGQQALSPQWSHHARRIIPCTVMSLWQYEYTRRPAEPRFKLVWDHGYNEGVSLDNIYRDTDENRKLAETWNKIQDQIEKLEASQLHLQTKFERFSASELLEEAPSSSPVLAVKHRAPRLDLE